MTACGWSHPIPTITFPDNRDARHNLTNQLQEAATLTLKVFVRATTAHQPIN